MRVAVLSSGRQDWGILRSTCLALEEDRRFELVLLVGGMHLEGEFGNTAALIAEAGLTPAERLAWIDLGASSTEQCGAALTATGSALARQSPDALMLVGDRFETAAAAMAATLERVPIVHLHGGEVTAGAVDDALRNAITKLSHLHLVSHHDHARRVVGLGEDPESVHMVGAPGLDNLHRSDLPTRAELERQLGVELRAPVVLVTLHPTTLATADEARSEMDAVLATMADVPATYVVSLPNSDPGHLEIRSALIEAAQRPGVVAVEALGDRWYWGMLRTADALLGNSSSAIIEAPSVQLPAVNIGARQAGRLRGANVIDVPAPTREGTIRALKAALAPETRARLQGTVSPFGDGHAAERILAVLGAWTPPKPPRKRPTELTLA